MNVDARRNVRRWRLVDTCYAAVFMALVCGIVVAVVQAKSRPAEVVPVEWYESLLNAPTVALDTTGWADAEVVLMVSQALRATMDPVSAGTWRPGFEAHLLLKGWTDVQIRAAVLKAYAVISIEVADAVFAELGKPSP